MVEQENRKPMKMQELPTINQPQFNCQECLQAFPLKNCLYEHINEMKHHVKKKETGLPEVIQSMSKFETEVEDAVKNYMYTEI